MFNIWVNCSSLHPNNRVCLHISSVFTWSVFKPKCVLTSALKATEAAVSIRRFTKHSATKATWPKMDKKGIFVTNAWNNMTNRGCCDDAITFNSVAIFSDYINLFLVDSIDFFCCYSVPLQHPEQGKFTPPHPRNSFHVLVFWFWPEFFILVNHSGE